MMHVAKIGMKAMLRDIKFCKLQNLLRFYCSLLEVSRTVELFS
ncbi:hypothetical protein SLEP1_g58376 [Rubroshorea leprosula]|uniref:Uncharacterized protein n=1 Tax=Rubroshorea leprosula TaxID=152421 RepID=A0AAV5MP84_9ROSI|nr:hypothetical protein SLEP1_g58376 [Rubroshorea leprosula]